MSRTVSTTRFSRHALPPAPRLRHRSDLGVTPALLAAGALIMVLWVDSAFAAGPRGAALRVEESAELDVVVTVEASVAPTFQVFRLPGQPRFAVELPGLAPDTVPQISGAGALLLDAALEAAGKGGTPRLVLSFAADVDYDAVARGTTLEVRFSHHGDKAQLRAAAQERRERAAALAREREEAAARVAAETRARADEAERAERGAAERRLAAAEAKRKADDDKKAALEKKRQDEEAARLAAADAKRKADDEKKAALEKKRQEEEAARLAAAEAKRKADDEKKAAL
ncbi:MAG: hypothetical protein IT383_20675, partial [Deltaproteobacteria bacterium]|nr:hypothetical protein [Deltaproteobacteria bacterium]